MQLAQRLNLFVAVAAAAALLLSAGVARFVVLGSFEAQERLMNEADIARVKAALDTERRRLNGLVSDWATWDDAYAFMTERNEAFIRSNLVEAVFHDPDIGLDAILFLTNEGALWYATGVSWVTNPQGAFLPNLVRMFQRTGRPLAATTGIGRLRDTEPPFVYATHPIHRSDQSGEARGLLVMVRCLNNDLLATLSDVVQHNLTLIPATGTTAASTTLALGTLQTDVPIVNASGAPIAALRFTSQAIGYQRGRNTALLVLGISAVATLVAAAVAQRLLQRTVVQRVENLVGTISEIRQSADLTTRVETAGGDEITQLAEQINGMLERLKQQEATVRQLERYEAQHQMSAGISHNLNNLLTSVIGGAELLLRFSDVPQVRERAQSILSASRQAGDLVARLDALFDPPARETVAQVDLNEIVHRVIQDTAPQWRDGTQINGTPIRVVEHFETGLPLIQANPGDLYNAVLNLVLNAINAMPGGGLLALSTTTANDEVELRVRDEGVGMDSETRRQIFDPFFTTSPGVGRGLGLATVMRTVVQSEGTVEVLSAPGQGAEFRLRFPAAVSRSAPPRITAPAKPHGGRILVADDHPPICALLEELLGDEHEVQVFNDFRTAATAITAGPWNVAILGLDLPDMPGHELAHRIRRIWPDACLVLLTGWELTADDPRLAPFDHHLRKPIRDLAQLRAIVSSALA